MDYGNYIYCVTMFDYLGCCCCYLDHVVVLRPGGYPMAINKDKDNESQEVHYIEDIDTVEGNQMSVGFVL